MSEDVAMTWDQWKAAYMKEIARLTGMTTTEADHAATAAKELYDDEPDLDPLEAVQAELSYWTD